MHPFLKRHARYEANRRGLIENGQTVRCPVCNSTNVIAVQPFDYVKQCENKKCSYHVDHPKGWKYQFSTGVHN